MTCGEMFSNDDSSDIFLLLIGTLPPTTEAKYTSLTNGCKGGPLAGGPTVVMGIV